MNSWRLFCVLSFPIIINGPAGSMGKVKGSCSVDKTDDEDIKVVKQKSDEEKIS